MQCIRLPEDNDLLLPDFEIFLTSRRLGARIIEAFKSYTYNPPPSTINRDNYRNTLLNLMDKAKLIIIVSPFLDEETKDIFDKLLEKFNRKEQMRVLIFTRETTYNENKYRFEEIKKFARIYTLNNLHSKIYIFDNNILWGSVNLTRSSLKGNVETLTISNSQATLYDILGDFIKNVLKEKKLSFSQLFL
jgi:phosphatidylserine/phosphatidylglycerophosphate/cardiolipin synthase-like enzyme